MITEPQFNALAKLLRLRQGQAQEAAQLSLVHGIPAPDVARKIGMDYRAAVYAINRAKSGLALAKIAAGAEEKK